jgi:hypothetical protein
MVKFLKYSIALALICFFTAQVQAQKFDSKKRYWSLGATFNAVNYFGDLAPLPNKLSTDFAFTRPQIGFIATYRFHPRMSVRFGLSWLRLSGDDASSAKVSDEENGLFRYRRNLNFRNDIVELNSVLIVDLFENRGIYRKRRRGFIPYAFLGIAGIYHNPYAKLNDTYVELFPLKTEGTDNGRAYSNFAFAIPFGIGVRKGLTARLDVGVEIGYRYTFTDELDDVSTYYPDDLYSRSGNAFRLSSRAADLDGSLTGNPRDPKAFEGQTFVVKSGSDWVYVDYATFVTLPASVRANAALSGFDSGIDPVEQKAIDSGNGQFIYTEKERRGNKDLDSYLVYGFNASYIINVGVKCPKFR